MEAKINIDETSKTAELKLEGRLLIQNASKLKEVLTGALNAANTCVLDLEEVQLFDLSSIQLFYAFHLAAKQQDKKFTLKADCPRLFKEAVESAGLSWTRWLCFGEV
ncbi:STAS domain-containing protein [bacterium]|nr:STAS domain-containing protein [bacterium]